MKIDNNSETHNPVWSGHPGMDRMVALLERSYYWPKLAEDQIFHYLTTTATVTKYSKLRYIFKNQMRILTLERGCDMT